MKTKCPVCNRNFVCSVCNSFLGVTEAQQNEDYLKCKIERLKEVLKPFTHPDLSKKFQGNAEGNKSIIFQRNDAKITLGDCRKACEVYNEN